MHFGNKNKEFKYVMNFGENEAPHKIEKTLVERDVRIMISNDVKWADQVIKAIIAQLRNS